MDCCRLTLCLLSFMLSVHSYANDTYFSFFTPTTITKNEGIMMAFGCAYDSDHFTYGQKDKTVTYEGKINPICLLVSMYTSTYVHDYVDIGIEMVMKFPFAAKHSGNISTTYPTYEASISTVQSTINAKNVKEPFNLEIKPQQSTGTFFRFGYHLSNIDAILFFGIGLMFTSVKFTIYGKSLTNDNVNVNLASYNMKETSPTLTIGLIKHIGRRSSLRIQYTAQMAKDSKFNDDLHIEHTVKQKTNSFALMYSYYL